MKPPLLCGTPKDSQWTQSPSKMALSSLVPKGILSLSTLSCRASLGSRKRKDNNLKCVRLGSKNIIREIELSIEMGYSALIENMGE